MYFSKPDVWKVLKILNFIIICHSILDLRLAPNWLVTWWCVARDLIWHLSEGIWIYLAKDSRLGIEIRFGICPSLFQTDADLANFILTVCMRTRNGLLGYISSICVISIMISGRLRMQDVKMTDHRIRNRKEWKRETRKCKINGVKQLLHCCEVTGC